MYVCMYVCMLQPTPMEKYLGIPGILCRSQDCTRTHTYVYTYVCHSLPPVEKYLVIPGILCQSQDVTGTHSLPLWKSISGYPGYCADPRIVLRLIHISMYVCMYVIAYLLGKVSRDTRDTVPIPGSYWNSEYTRLNVTYIV